MFGIFRSKYAQENVLREKLKNGDDGAFRYLYRAYYPASENLVLQNGGASEEAVALHRRAVIDAYERIVSDTLRTDYSTALYVFSFVRKEWRRTYWLRAGAHTPAWIETGAYIDLPEETESYTDSAADRAVYARLSPADRQLLQLYYYHKRTSTELASLLKLGTTENAKKERYRVLREWETLLQAYAARAHAEIS